MEYSFYSYLNRLLVSEKRYEQMTSFQKKEDISEIWIPKDSVKWSKLKTY